MKLRFLLMVFILSSNIVRADAISYYNLNVDEAYFLYNRDINYSTYKEMFDKIGFYGYLRGVINTLHFINGEEYDCINRPTELWIDVFFDEYKQNKIKGSDYFIPKFIGIVYRVCNIKHK